jgi:hypothetical protein
MNNYSETKLINDKHDSRSRLAALAFDFITIRDGDPFVTDRKKFSVIIEALKNM